MDGGVDDVLVVGQEELQGQGVTLAGSLESDDLLLLCTSKGTRTSTP